LRGLNWKLPGNQTMASRVRRENADAATVPAVPDARTPASASSVTRSGRKSRGRRRCCDEKYRSWSVGARKACVARANATTREPTSAATLPEARTAARSIPSARTPAEARAGPTRPPRATLANTRPRVRGEIAESPGPRT
jgi:hypothetical protein